MQGSRREVSAQADIIARDARAIAPGLAKAFGIEPSSISYRAAPDGALAAATGRTISLSPRYAKLPEATRARVLAHELAHVAQKRRAPTFARRGPWAVGLLEAEAEMLAPRALDGLPCRPILGDAPETPSFWGPAGHYFTSLYVMLAAGGEERACYRRAFFCQMPDQVFDFDAVSAAVDYYQRESPGSVWIPIAGTFRPATPPEEIKYRTERRMEFDGMAKYWVEEDVETPESRLKRRTVDRQISTGLHSLTGRSGDKEIEQRAQLLRQNKDDDLRFGLALHCYGDAFAHQNPSGVMYPPISGHGAAGHTPDNCAKHSILYIRYIGGLWRIVRETMAQRTERIPFGKLLDSLQPIWSMKFDADDETVQRKHCLEIMLTAARNGLGAMTSYMPQYEAEVYWSKFWPAHTDMIYPSGGPQKVYETVRKCGAEWGM
jgi:hypothetical protein